MKEKKKSEMSFKKYIKIIFNFKSNLSFSLLLFLFVIFFFNLYFSSNFLRITYGIIIIIIIIIILFWHFLITKHNLKLLIDQI